MKNRILNNYPRALYHKFYEARLEEGDLLCIVITLQVNAHLRRTFTSLRKLNAGGE